MDLELPGEKTRWHYRFVLNQLGPFVLWLTGGLHVSGQEHIPKHTAALLCPNHISYLDPPLVGIASSRRCCYMAKKPLFRIPVLSLFIRKSYSYPLDRERGGRGAIRVATELLNAGELVVIYPEGTRSPDGEPIPCEPGAALIATRTQAPIVPAAIWGTDVVLPRHARRLYRCPIYVRFGEPLHPPTPGEGRRVDKTRVRQFNHRLQNTMRSLHREVKQRVPDCWLERADRMRRRWRRIHAPEAEQLRRQLEGDT